MIDHDFSVEINLRFAQFEANIYMRNNEFRDVIHDYFTESLGWDTYRTSPMEWKHMLPPHIWNELVTLKVKEEAEKAYHEARNLASEELEAMDISWYELGETLAPASW